MRAVKLMFTMLLAMALAGCWGSRETDELAYVLAMGFDKGPENSVIMTFQISNPKTIAGQVGGGGGGGQEAKPLINTSTVAQLPIGAFNLLNTELSREISLLHTRAFIFSEEFAREGLETFLLPLNRFLETRGTAYVFVSRGKARDFLEANQPTLEISPSKRYDLVFEVNRQHALVPVVQFQEFYQRTKVLDIEAVATLVGINKEGLKLEKKLVPGKIGDYLAGDLPSNKGQLQFLGTAVFRADKMVGDLTGDQTRYLNMMTGKMDRSFIFVTDPLKSEKQIGLRLIQARRPQIKVRMTPERAVIDVHVYQEPEIVGLPSGINYESPELKPVLEKALSDLFERRCRELVKITQEEFRADIFGFGRYARRLFLTRSDWERADWRELYPLAEVNIHAHVKIRRTGLRLETTKMVE